MKEVQREWTKETRKPKYVQLWQRQSRHPSPLKHFKRGSLVLEAGSGTGGVCFWLEQNGISSVGIEIVPNKVKLAHLQAKAKGSKVEFITGDVTYLPFKDDSMDGVISLGVIEHFRSKDEVFLAFKESIRVLKKGGKALYVIPNVFVALRNSFLLFISKGNFGMYHKSYSVNAFFEMASLCGFALLQVDVINLWLPVFLVIDGLVKNLKVDKRLRLKIAHFFMRLPDLDFLKVFLGYIQLIGKKP